MKKMVISLWVLMFVFGIVSPSYAANGNENSNGTQIKKVSVEDKLIKEQEKMIKAVEPYVEVKEDGIIGFKDVPKNIYNKYNLDKLQEHFDILNNAVENETITINEDLSIQDNSFSTYAVYGKWTYNWWGYDRNFNNSQAIALSNYAASVAGGAGIVTGITYMFPPVAAIAGVATGYWSLVAARVNANNKGKGVYVGVTWVAAFNISPL
jgi:hypothetical protein